MSADVPDPEAPTCESCTRPTQDADVLCPSCWNALHDAASESPGQQVPTVRALATRVTARLQRHLPDRALTIAAEFREGTEAAKAMADALETVLQDLAPDNAVAPSLIVLAAGAREWAEHAHALLAQLDSHTRNLLAHSYAAQILKAWQ
jgi:predicted amidophosphoribosyltransferase